MKTMYLMATQLQLAVLAHFKTATHSEVTTRKTRKRQKTLSCVPIDDKKTTLSMNIFLY